MKAHIFALVLQNNSFFKLHVNYVSSQMISLKDNYIRKNYYKFGAEQIISQIHTLLLEESTGFLLQC